MLAGQAEQLETRVYKSESEVNFWADYPIVFRMCLLPVVLYTVFKQYQSEKTFVLVNLGAAGEEFDLENEHLAKDPNDPPELGLSAYVAQSTFQFQGQNLTPKRFGLAILTLLQMTVWCMQGENIVMTVLGEHGEELPDWTWEHVKEGPEITNIRLLSFDEPDISDFDGSSEDSDR